MKQRITHGATIETATPDEVGKVVANIIAADTSERNRVRAAATVKLDATGAGQDEIYSVPAGREFEARRVTVDLDTSSDPNTGNVVLNVAGRALELLRSGTRVEYLAPVAPGGSAQVPGVQSWGEEQGPYFRNGETVEVKVRGLTANATLDITVEGILFVPASRKGKGY